LNHLPSISDHLNSIPITVDYSVQLGSKEDRTEPALELSSIEEKISFRPIGYYGWIGCYTTLLRARKLYPSSLIAVDVRRVCVSDAQCHGIVIPVVLNVIDKIRK
jgi:hypothetical protein